MEGKRSEGDFKWLDGCFNIVGSFAADRDVSTMKLDGTLEAVVSVFVDIVLTAAEINWFLVRGSAESYVLTEALANATKTLDERGAATVVVSF